MKVRVKFSKQGSLKFIGHLDMLRYFQKAIKRAGLPIAYSEGFNPHQIMTFSSPLGLGMTSTAEYMDIELTEEVPSEEGVSRLNDVMVEDITVLSFKYLPEKSKNAMSATVAAEYKVTLGDKLIDEIGADFNYNKELSKFLSQKACIILKKTKKSEREIDILPLIYDFSVEDKIFSIKCSSGSNDNLKPEVIMEEYLRFSGYDEKLDRVNLKIERTELYTGDTDNLISLDDIGINEQ